MNYKAHCAFNYLIVFPIACGLLYALNQWSTAVGIVLGLGFYFGTSWISPDLDINSKPTNKHGWIWKLLWYPYRAFSKHRGRSHTVVQGFVIRIAYIAIIFATVLYAFVPMWWVSKELQIVGATFTIVLLSLFLLGIAIANAGHILLDRIT
jgi:uncharacterized metal-binding protein